MTLRARRRAEPAPDAADTASIVVRFSSPATVTVLAAGVTGSFLAWNEVRSIHALTSTDYGRLLMAKAAAVAVVAGLGAYNHFRLLPALSAGKARAALAPAPPPVRVEARAAGGRGGAHLGPRADDPRPDPDQGGPVERIIQLGDVGSVQLVVAPAKAGFNQIHLYTFDPEGRPTDLAESIELELSLPAADIGPLVRTATRAGPAHAQLNGNDLAVAGRWEITVRLRIDKFTEVSGDTDVPVAT